MKRCSHPFHGLRYCVGQVEINMIRANKESFKRILHISGTILVVASVGFIAILLWSQKEVVLAWRPSASDVFLLVFSILSYAMAGMLLAKVWRELLLWSGEINVTASDVFRIYGRSQIAKYIPGNIAQLIGRHAIGIQAGWSHTGLVLAGTLEMVSLLFVASLIAIVGLSLNAVTTDLLSLPLVILFAGCLIFGTIITLRIMPRMVEARMPEVAERLRGCKLGSLWHTSLMHLAFFGISGLVFLLLGYIVFDNFLLPSKWPGVIGLVALAWVAGIVTPGAPSGIGIREGILTLGLASFAPVGEVLLLVTLFRLVTVLGDTVFFLISSQTIK